MKATRYMRRKKARNQRALREAASTIGLPGRDFFDLRCASSICGHTRLAHGGGLGGGRCTQPGCKCRRFKVAA